MALSIVLIYLNIVCFFGYGLSCIFSNKMKSEFTRYGLSSYRQLTGWLQLLGSTGLAMGFIFPPLTHFSSLGLSLLMLLGIAVRIRIHDPLIAIIPAFVFMCLNLIIFLVSLEAILDVQFSF